MLPAEAKKQAEQRRLAWRCRRGMLELDIVLQRFVVNHFNDLSAAEMQEFDELLALPDNTFWALLSAPTTEQLGENMSPLTLKIITKMTQPASRLG